MDDPVKFISLNKDYFNGTEYHPPEGCSMNKAGTGEICGRTSGQKTRYSYWEWMLTSKPHVFGLFGGWANPTGILLLLILTVMFICSLPFVRRRGHFEVNYIYI